MKFRDYIDAKLDRQLAEHLIHMGLDNDQFFNEFKYVIRKRLNEGGISNWFNNRVRCLCGLGSFIVMS
jgi:hypothetical protein